MECGCAFSPTLHVSVVFSRVKFDFLVLVIGLIDPIALHCIAIYINFLFSYPGSLANDMFRYVSVNHGPDVMYLYNVYTYLVNNHLPITVINRKQHQDIQTMFHNPLSIPPLLIIRTSISYRNFPLSTFHFPPYINFRHAIHLINVSHIPSLPIPSRVSSK